MCLVLIEVTKPYLWEVCSHVERRSLFHYLPSRLMVPPAVMTPTRSAHDLGMNIFGKADSVSVVDGGSSRDLQGDTRAVLPLRSYGMTVAFETHRSACSGAKRATYPVEMCLMSRVSLLLRVFWWGWSV